MKTSLSRALFLAAFAHLALELSNNYLPVVYPLLIDELGLTFTQIGVITFVGGFGGSLLQPIFGYLSDRFGPVGLTALSVAWTGVVMGLVGYTGNYWLLVLLVGLGGLGSAAFHPPGSVIASLSGGKRRGASLSVFSVGGNIGSALSPIVAGIGLSLLGLRGTILITPIALLSGLFLYIQLRQFYQKHGLSEKAQPTQADTSTQAAQLAKAGSTLGLTLLVLVVMTRSWYEMSFKTYLPVWLEMEGASLEIASRAFVVLLMSISVGSLIGGTLSDRIGSWQVVGLSVFLLAISHWLFMHTAGLGQLVFVALNGVMVGSTFPVSIVIAHQMWPNRAGMASALVMGLGWLPGGIGAAITGRLADQFSLTLGLQTLVIAPLAGVVCVLVYMVLQRRIRRSLRLEAI